MNIKTEYSTAELAAMVGVSRWTMRRRLLAYGISCPGKKKIGIAVLRAKLPEWADFEVTIRVRQLLAQ